MNNKQKTEKNKQIVAFGLFIVYCLLFIATFAGPFDAAAQGSLVPCGRTPGQGVPTAETVPCEPCHIFSLIQNIFNFIWKFLA